MPRIHPGFSHMSLARSPATRRTAAHPSVIGGQSDSRSGSTQYGASRRASTLTSFFTKAFGLLMAARYERDDTSAMSRSV